MEPARRPSRRFDPFSTRQQRSRSWIEIGRCVERGKEVGRELLLSELTFAITLLHTATLQESRGEATRMRKRAREIHDAVEHWLPRFDLHGGRAGRISARLCELRWRLEAGGETF
jgi:hypothetical protein